MADCNKNIYKSSGCDDFEVGDGNITLEQCGDRIGTFSLDQCHDETIEIPCPCDGALNFYVDGNKEFTFTANQCYDTNYNLDPQTITDAINWKDFPICDECFKWCNGEGNVSKGGARTDCKGCGTGSAGGDPAVRTLKLVKFWSQDCGICHRMSHYDSKVAKELGVEFISVNEYDDRAWDAWVHVAEPLYSDTDGMGWPTYILVDHASKSNFVTIGEVVGGSDKGKFRRELNDLINDDPQPSADNALGGDKKSHCVPFDEKNCSPFRWDCINDEVVICAGAKGHIALDVSTHGCNSRCGEEDGGKELDYKWQFSKDNTSFRDFGSDAIGSDKSEFDFKLKYIPGSENLEAGDKVWLRAVATCKDHPRNTKITGGGGNNDNTGNNRGSQDIKVTIVDCCGGDSVCPNGKTCCNKTDHPDMPEGCQTCCKNRHCPTGQICKNGRCVDDVECNKDSDCGPGKCCQGNNTCADCPDCVNNNDCASNKCEECKDGKCKSKCGPGFICKNGNCAEDTPDPEPEPPSSGTDCGNGQCKDTWWIDWDCVARKMSAARRDYQFDLEKRIEYLETKIKES